MADVPGGIAMGGVPFIRPAVVPGGAELPAAAGVAPGGFDRIGAAGLGAHAPLGAFAPAAAVGGVPLAFAAGGLGANDYQDALEKVHYLQGYMTNSRDVARKLADFRDYALQRLRQIVVRLQSIGQIAGAGAAAQASLIQLIQDINAAGGPTQAQAQAMADLAAEMQNVDIPAEIAALVTEVNNLAAGLNAQADIPGPPAIGVQGGVAVDTGANAPPFPLVGGRRKRKKAKKSRKKKKKGGFKFTRAAISRRSLRQSRRKSLSRHNTKYKRHKKRKQTKKRRRRRR